MNEYYFYYLVFIHLLKNIVYYTEPIDGENSSTQSVLNNQSMWYNYIFCELCICKHMHTVIYAYYTQTTHWYRMYSTYMALSYSYIIINTYTPNKFFITSIIKLMWNVDRNAEPQKTAHEMKNNI